MKKLLLSLSLLASAATVANAQTIKYGVKVGPSLTTFSGKDADGAKNQWGFNGGVFANFGITDMVSIQPEVLYSMKGAKYSESLSGLTQEANSRLHYIDVPILAKVATGETGLFFELGPQVGFLAAANNKVTTTVGGVSQSSTSTDKDGYKTVDFGYVGGLGYQLESGPIVGLRYNGGLAKIGKDPDGSAEAAAVRNSAFQLYVGFQLGGK